MNTNLLAYKNYLINQNKSMGTVDGYLFDIGMIEKVTAKSTELLTKMDVQIMLNSMQGKSPSTINRRIKALRSYMDFLVEMEIITVNIAKSVKAPKIPERKVVHMELEEAEQFLDSITDKKDRAIAEVFLNTGLRLAELISLNLVDIEKEYIKVIRKGNKEDYVYLNEACREAVESYLVERPTSEDTALFLGKDGKRIGRRSVQCMIKKYCEKIGFGKGSPHRLRATLATLLAEANVPVFEIQTILNHSSPNTTRFYVDVSQRQVKKSLDKSPLNRGRGGNNE